MASGARAKQTQEPKGIVLQVPTLAGLVDSGWSTFTSVRLAIFLILALTVASILGAGIMQAPPPAMADPQQYEMWLGAARARYGWATDVMDRLQIFYIFTSIWFRALLMLLAANIVVCTLNRAPKLLSMARRAPVPRVAATMFERAPLGAAVHAGADDLDDAENAAIAALRRHRFRVYLERTEDALHLVGEKNRYAPLFTLVHHAGLVLILAAAVVGARGGFHESQFIVAEGDQRDVGHDTGLTIRVNSFVDEYYAGGGGMPKDYRSDIVVLKDGVEVKAGIVRVNEPVIYNGIRVHQSFYGPAISIRVAAVDGNRELYNGRVPLSFSTQDRPAGSFTIPELNLEIFLVSRASKFLDPVIKGGEVRVEIYEIGGSRPLAMQNLVQGEPTAIGPLELTFQRESRFTGLQVVKDPALPFLWLGTAIIVVGSMIVLTFPHRRLWVRVERDPRGRATVRLAAPRERGLPFEYEFKRIQESLERRLGATDRTG